MKKFLLMLGLLISTNVYAGTISIQPFISGNDVTITALETQRSTIQNVINGNIEGGGQNIKQGSITSYDLAQAINPVVRFDEAFNDWTFTGMLPPTSGTLSSTTTAGISYVNGVRIQTSATAHSYTASKDTYVYINAGGFFDYQEVANGASAPSTPANDLLLAKVVTNGTAVTSVTDSRTTSIQITANNSNFATNYRDQSYISRDSTVNFYIQPGNFAIGNSNYSNTAVTSTRSIVTGANWIEGNYPSGYNGLVFIYGYNSSGTAYDFKFSSADVAFSDTSSSTAGIKRYYTSGGTNYRALGWAYLSADTVQTYGASDIIDIGVSNTIYFTSQTAASTTSTSFVNDSAVPLLKFYSSGRNVVITYFGGVDNGGNNSTFLGIMIDSLDIASTAKATYCNTGTTHQYTVVSEYRGILSRGIHSIQARVKAEGNTAYVNNRSIYVREE